MVSALNGLGVKEMCKTLKEDMGFRADLWVVGAQNGKILDGMVQSVIWGQRHAVAASSTSAFCSRYHSGS